MQQFATSLVMKLQLMIAKLNASLEDQSDTIISNLLPRLLREVESLQHETVRTFFQLGVDVAVKENGQFGSTSGKH